MKKTGMACAVAGMMAGVLCGAELMPLPYVCQRTDEAMVIDGSGDEAVWGRAAKFSPLRDIEGGAVDDGTEIRMLWDDDYLYILADMPEEDLWATQREHDSVVYRDPDFEVFIDPQEEGNHYLELEVNALGTVWDLFLARTYRLADPVVLHDWEMRGLKHAVKLHGTLNCPGDKDRGWSVELAIPWRCITSHGTQPRKDEAPEPGRTMRFNFSRVNWQVEPDAASPCGYSKVKGADGNPLPESNHVWAPTGVVNIHRPEHWGRVVFSAQPAGVWESAEPDPEDDLRIAMYGYLHGQQAAYKEQGAYSAALAAPAGTQAEVRPHHFLLQGTCARTGRLLQLDSNGQFTARKVAEPFPQVYLWVHGGEDTGNTELWTRRFAEYAAAGVDTVVVDGSVEQVRTLTPLARRAGLQVVAWLWTMNRPGDALLAQHPECYAVSREGKSCHVEADRPYVAYYQFLCPNSPKVLQHLLERVDELAAVPGLSGIQLDYLRLPDVILPRGLWEKYGLVMDRELPAYDFCYCEACRAKFRAEQGRDVQQEADKDTAWREFRLQSVANVAAALCGRIRSHGLRAACAVFPTPQVAGRLVRQDWSRFPLDFALPMDYHSFYNEQPDWVLRMVGEARQQVQQRFPLAPGLHLPDTDAESLRAMLRKLRAAGVKGIGLFSSETLTADMMRVLREEKGRGNLN